MPVCTRSGCSGIIADDAGIKGKVCEQGSPLQLFLTMFEYATVAGYRIIGIWKKPEAVCSKEKIYV